MAVSTAFAIARCKQLNDLYQRLLLTFGHTHRNRQDGTDACAICGLDLRDDIHAAEWRGSLAKGARAALERRPSTDNGGA